MNELAQEMVSQDNLGTQYPYWFIQVDERQYVNQFDDWDECERREDYDRDLLCDDCKQREDTQNPNLEHCEECEQESFIFWLNVDSFDLRSGGYFTQKACQEHIDSNHYHYTNPRPYAYSAWRNPDLIMVMQSIITGAGLELPSQYR